VSSLAADMNVTHPLSEALSGIDATGTFAVHGKVPAEGLRLDVRGVGGIPLPISRQKARELCLVARPALHGNRDRTLLDRRVRDTWQIARNRITIDSAWNATLQGLLEKVRSGLGLQAESKLEARLHDLLIYAPGQFFLPHQDTEKDDSMMGTLVITLPSRFEGGAMVIEHNDQQVTFRDTGRALTFAAFYADCHHQVRPVTEGYRVVLTYDLSFGKTGNGRIALPASDAIDALEQEVRRFFKTRPPPTWSDGKPEEPPDRLVYLLDHQYSRRSLGWKRLKGVDAVRAAALLEVARRLDCEILLALADVHEVWGCEEEDGHGRYGSFRTSRWSTPYGYPEHDADDREEDEEYQKDEGGGFAGGSKDTPPLTELQDWSVELRHFVDPRGRSKPGASRPRDAEIIYTKASVRMRPFQSQHEGYMGNWGNTVERWYHRAAVVLWRREHTFVIRARMSASWAIAEISKSISLGRADDARHKAERVLPFWSAVAAPEANRELFGKTLRIAPALAQPTLAAALTAPFRIEHLTVESAPSLVAATERYGAAWFIEALARWSPSDEYGKQDERLNWLLKLARIVDVLRDNRSRERKSADGIARSIIEAQWAWLVDRYCSAAAWRPSEVSKALRQLDRSVLALLQSSAGYPDLRAEMLRFLTSDNAPVLSLVHLLQTAENGVRGREASKRKAVLEPIVHHCLAQLRKCLREPPRAADDWSIVTPEECRCALCAELARFLTDRKSVHFEWPLAKERRRHVHGVIDRHEMPVTHVTRRSGSPYTLVLDKTRALFDREAKLRAAWQCALDWLSEAELCSADAR
jgi:hypothetical protein